MLSLDSTYGFTDRTWQERGFDYGTGLVSFGVPTHYGLLDAIERGDMEEITYFLSLEAAIYGSYAGFLAFANAVQGAKYAISLKELHHVVTTIRMFGFRAAITVAPIITFAGMAAYGQGVRKSITAMSDIYAQAGIISIGPGKRSGWSQIRGRR